MYLFTCLTTLDK